MENIRDKAWDSWVVPVKVVKPLSPAEEEKLLRAAFQPTDEYKTFDEQQAALRKKKDEEEDALLRASFEPSEQFKTYEDQKAWCQAWCVRLVPKGTYKYVLKEKSPVFEFDDDF